MLDQNSKIHIVGGTGAMGTWLRIFLESLNFSVSVSDENKGEEEIEKADIVFISVPINLAPQIILQTAPKTKHECLMVDLSSIKSETKKALENCGRSSLSLHFLFGPTLSSIQNQKIISEKFKQSKIADDLVQVFKKEGAQIIELPSDLHDLTMAHIQSLTHFINLSLAQILIKNKIGISGQISTPVFLSQLSATLRVLSQSPKLLSEIQTQNPEFINVVEDYLEIQKDLVKKIKTGDVKEIEKQYAGLRENLESISGTTDNSKRVVEDKVLEPKNLKVGFLGPKGTFSSQAVLKLFNETDNRLIACKSIYDLFDSLDKNLVDVIVAPAENTTEGTVRETLDYLFDHKFKIIGKIDLSVSQCLLSKESDLKNITKIISHPQALNQSRKFLEDNLPDAILETSASTVASTEELDKKGVAIIGSELAAKIYKLNTLKKDIQGYDQNTTRFNIIAKRDMLNLPGRSKSLLFLSVFNRVGVLRDILSVFADLSINLNKIESRPSGEKHWDYYFYIEVESTDEHPKFLQALDILKQYCPQIIVLGKL